MTQRFTAWRFHAGTWHSIGTASTLAAAGELIDRLYPEEAARHNLRFAISGGCPPTWTPRRNGLPVRQADGDTSS